MEVKDFFRVIRKRILLLILVPLIAMLIALIFVRMKDNQYVSRVTFATGITDPTLSVNIAHDMNPTTINMRFSNLIGLMNSRLIFDFLSYELLLHDLTADVPFRSITGYRARRYLEDGRRQEIINHLEQKLRDLDHVDYGREPGESIRRLLIIMEYDYDSLKDHITIYRYENSDYIQIQAVSEDPDLSAFMANTLAKYFFLWYERNRTNNMNTSIGFYNDKVVASRELYDRLVREMERFTVENRISNLYEQAKQVSIQIMELELKKAQELSNLRGFSTIVDTLDTVLGSGAPYYREAAISGLNSDLAESRRKIAEYRRNLVMAQSANRMDQAAVYQDSLRAEMDRNTYLLDLINEKAFIDPKMARQDLLTSKFQAMSDIELARQSIRVIDLEIARLEDVTTEYARRRARYESLDRDIETARQEYITLLNKLNEQRLAAAALQVGAMMDIIERAFASTDPMPHKRWLIVIIAGLAAFVFTLLAIFALEYFDTRAQTPMDIANLTGQPVISGIPVFDDNIFDLPKLFTSSALSVKEQAALDLIRQLRLYLMKHMPGKRLLITSTQPGAGKSFLTLFLGFSLARAGKRVLLIDMQSRNQTLTRQLDAKPTLQQYLAGKMVASEAITKTDSKFIDILGCENDIRTPLEITTHENIEERISYFEQYYDYILIDATALIRSNIGREIVHHADASLLVMDADTEITNADNNAIKFLTRLADVKFMGIVMNKVQLENLSDFYGEVKVQKPVRSRAPRSSRKPSPAPATASGEAKTPPPKS